jgi:hypothetical protein
MPETTAPFTYRHTQKGPWHLLLYASAAAILAVAWLVRAHFWLEDIFLATGLIVALLGASLQQLTVEDEGNQLAVRFGPLPLWRKRIWYDDIQEVGKGRVSLHDSYGVHWSRWGGWVFSVRGRDCVAIRLRRGILRVGTDDPDGLLRFLENRIAKRN